jgi:hypothetical protein
MEERLFFSQVSHMDMKTRWDQRADTMVSVGHIILLTKVMESSHLRRPSLVWNFFHYDRSWPRSATI